MHALLLVLLVILGSTSHSALGQELPKLVIGAVYPVSGPLAPFGLEAAQGMELALERIRSLDPKYGERIQIKIEDDKSLTAETRAAAERLFVKERAHVMIGSVTDAETSSLMKAASEHGRPLIAPSSATLSAGRGGEWIFATAFDEGAQGELLATFALTTLKAKTAGILHEDGAAGSPFVTQFQSKFIAGGGKIVATETYKLEAQGGAASHKALESLKKLKPDAVLLAAFPEVATGILKAASAMKLGAPFLGGDSWDGAMLAQAAKAGEAEGHFFLSHFSALVQEPVVQQFVQEFRAKYKRQPGVIAAQCFDAVMVIFEAFKRAHMNLPVPLTRELARTQNFVGVTGVLGLRPGEAPTQSAYVMMLSKTGTQYRGQVGQQPALPATPSPTPTLSPSITP